MASAYLHNRRELTLDVLLVHSSRLENVVADNRNLFLVLSFFSGVFFVEALCGVLAIQRVKNNWYTSAATHPTIHSTLR
jgi:hypothetical protein